jgi:hypothetical protein
MATQPHMDAEPERPTLEPISQCGKPGFPDVIDAIRTRNQPDDEVDKQAALMAENKHVFQRSLSLPLSYS